MTAFPTRVRAHRGTTAGRRRATVCAVALTLAALGCGRRAGEEPALTPAAGQREPEPRGVPSGWMEAFVGLDQNGDGYVAIEEFGALPLGSAGELSPFWELDHDGDGVLTAQEFCSRWRQPKEGERADRN